MSLQSRDCLSTKGVVNIAGTHGQYARNLQKCLKLRETAFYVPVIRLFIIIHKFCVIFKKVSLEPVWGN